MLLSPELGLAHLPLAVKGRLTQGDLGERGWPVLLAARLSGSQQTLTSERPLPLSRLSLSGGTLYPAAKPLLSPSFDLHSSLTCELFTLFCLPPPCTRGRPLCISQTDAIGQELEGWDAVPCQEMASGTHEPPIGSRGSRVCPESNQLRRHTHRSPSWCVVRFSVK